MEAKYKVGEQVLIDRDNEILNAIVFAHVNLKNKLAYSLRIGNHFIFVEEDRIIKKTDE